MADGYFERGEVYGVRMDNGVGSEEGYYRPGVIVSSNSGNNTSPTVNVCYTTKTIRNGGINFDTMVTGVRSWILCNQIVTVDKRRLGTRMGVLTAAELQKLDSCLEKVLDLGYINDEEVEGLKTEVAILKAKLEAAEEAKKDELLSLRVESEMWQKLYMKALDQVVNTKFGADVAIRTERKPAVEPKPVKVESPVESKPPVTEGSGSTDINHCTETELKKLGFSTAMARLIVSYRPFKDVPDLKRVPGMSKVKYQIIEQKVCCTPVVVEKPVVMKDEPDAGFEPEPKKYGKSNIVWDGVKVNVNTVRTGEEIFKRTGLNMKACTEIVKYREEHGSYEKVEDLLKLERFGPIVMKRYGHMMEV